MAVQLNYLAQKGWKPHNTDKDFVITFLKLELSKQASLEAKGKSKKELFEQAAASVAAESSTGTWTRVYAGKDSGLEKAEKYRAIAYDLDHNNFVFKVAYPIKLFELDNISGLLAGIIGNIAGMKMVKAMRIFDIKLPKKIISSFPGPAFGIRGVRQILRKPEGPLVITVPKPKIGRTEIEQANLARILFTSGNGTYDGIKDDENLTNLEFNNFEKRAELVLKEAQKAEKQTGNKKIYLCNITHSNINKMLERIDIIKKYNGKWLMIDVITTGFAAIDSIRRANTGLAIHAHRAMHGFLTRDNSRGIHGHGTLNGFSISMIVLAKLFRLLGVDSLHGGSPLAKMEDYNESVYIKKILQEKNLLPDKDIPSLGQNWYHIKPVWMTASGGLHPGDIETIMKNLGENIIMQFGGGLLGHPQGIEKGVEAIETARDLAIKKIPLKNWIAKNPKSALAAAVKLWGYGPRIVY